MGVAMVIMRISEIKKPLCVIHSGYILSETIAYASAYASIGGQEQINVLSP